MTDDLLTQARQLALIDVGKPKQTNLRRAISAVYYAVFHLFVDDFDDRPIRTLARRNRHALPRIQNQGSDSPRG